VCIKEKIISRKGLSLAKNYSDPDKIVIPKSGMAFR